jgi:hypothetical protein
MSEAQPLFAVLQQRLHAAAHPQPQEAVHGIDQPVA